MHFARFDVAVLQHTWASPSPRCAAPRSPRKLVRTFTDRHGLRICARSCWAWSQQAAADLGLGRADLSAEQLAYAASDVLYLHALWARLEALLLREGRLDLAEACFAFLPARARLDLLGYEDPDIFAH